MHPSQDKVLKLLFRSTADGADPAAQSYLDRLLIRVYSSTSLMVYLYDARVTDQGQVELVFNELPAEIIDKVVQLIGAEKVEVFTFRSEDSNHIFHGFRATPQEAALEEL